MVGPWEQTIERGFEQLMMQVDGKQIVPPEWVTVYYDNPDAVPAEKLRCDITVSVPEGFGIPENGEGVIQTELAGGDYAIAVARTKNRDFTTPWYRFFERLLQDSTYVIAIRPRLEVYMNNGMGDGYWNIETYVPVQSK